MSGALYSWPALEKKLQSLRRRRKKIVFTNGCFDVLHAGHLKVLRQARKHGDFLVLGLNSDASARRLKGPKRPVVPERERAELLAALEPVDAVALFSEDTPARLIALVRPDVLVKGGDWKASQIVGREVAKKVVRVPLVRGRSTTDVIAKIVRAYGPRTP